MFKKLYSLLLVSGTALMMTAMVACSGGGSATTVPTLTGSTQVPIPQIRTTPPATAATSTLPTLPAGSLPAITVVPPAGGGASWNDMPTYSASSEVQKGAWAIPATEGGYNVSEWHYYQSTDSLDKVAPSLRSQMAANGWTEAGWFEVPGQMSWGSFTKNGQNDAAMVWVSTQGTSGTVIALWRASR